MRRRVAISILALVALAVLSVPASAAPNPMIRLPVLNIGRIVPTNDYGVLSPEVVKQRFRMAGYEGVTNLVKTSRGYRATVMKDGAAHVLDIDTVKGHIFENGLRIHLPATTFPSYVNPILTQPVVQPH